MNRARTGSGLSDNSANPLLFGGSSSDGQSVSKVATVARLPLPVALLTNRRSKPTDSSRLLLSLATLAGCRDWIWMPTSRLANSSSFSRAVSLRAHTPERERERPARKLGILLVLANASK